METGGEQLSISWDPSYGRLGGERKETKYATFTNFIQTKCIIACSFMFCESLKSGLGFNTIVTNGNIEFGFTSSTNTSKRTQ